MEVESVYEDGEEEGLFVMREGIVVLMVYLMCAGGVIKWLARTAYGWAAKWCIGMRRYGPIACRRMRKA